MYRCLLFILIISFQAFSAQKTLTVAVNIGPPWAYFEEGKGMTGIDVEIIRHVFNKHGYDTEFHLLAYNRLIKDFNDGKFDIASPAAFASESGYFSQPYLPFKDVAISLKTSNLDISTLADLSGKRIVAYQHATSVLGPKYAMTVKDANYIELAEREVQLTLLAHDRTDVVIGERRLLTYINALRFPDKELVIHPIFDTKNYPAVFKDKALQALFDKELKRMQVTGEFQAILNMWP